MSKLSKLLKKKTKRAKLLPEYLTPAWKGPLTDGVTQSILGQYFVCPERFRITFVEGLKEQGGFNHAIEYGQMWHLCEECLKRSESWKPQLKKFVTELCTEYPYQQEQIDKWFKICTLQFSIYETVWKEDTSKSRVPMFQEKEFKIDYPIGGLEVVLRGKWDAVDYWKRDGVYLTENKSKGTIDEDSISLNLSFDLQVGTYLVALRKYMKTNQIKGVPNTAKIKGVNYNVVRRPLSGGRGSIRQLKGSKNVPPETEKEYHDRLRKIIEDDKDYFFMRWDMGITDSDLDKFEEQCLNPILGNLCDDFVWWEYCIKNKGISPFDFSVRAKEFPEHQRRHYRTPYGIWNTISQKVTGDLDHYLATNNSTGLVRTTEMFPELSNV